MEDRGEENLAPILSVSFRQHQRVKLQGEPGHQCIEIDDGFYRLIGCTHHGSHELYPPLRLVGITLLIYQYRRVQR